MSRSNSLTLAPAPRSEAAERVRLEVREFLAAELAAGGGADLAAELYASGLTMEEWFGLATG